MTATTCVMCDLPKATQETIDALARGERTPAHCWARAGEIDGNVTGEARVLVLASAMRQNPATGKAGLLEGLLEDHRRMVGHQRYFNCMFTTLMGSLFRAAEMPFDPNVEFDPGVAIHRLCRLIKIGLQHEQADGR